MRPEEFSGRLRRGAAEVAAQSDPAPAGAIRRRGQRRRQRTLLTSGLLAFAIGAGGGGYAYASFTTTAGGNPPISGATQSTTPAANSGGRPSIVAVTTAGSVVVLNPVTGEATTTLTGTQDAVGDEVSVSPDGSTAYFAIRPKGSCADQIESVPLAGGKAAVVAAGVLPAISPDGTELAFVHEQFGGGVSPVQFGCEKDASIQVDVLNLATHMVRTYPAPPEDATLVSPVSHLSWSPDGSTLLVSSGPVQDNEGWTLSRLNTGTSSYYLPHATQSASDGYVQSAAPGSYFEEGVYLPDGDLFADRKCCTGEPVKTTSSVLQEVSGSGTEIRQVAVGYLNRVHSSLDATSGWLLYLSGTDLFVAADASGAKAKTLTTGYIAAAWVP